MVSKENAAHRVWKEACDGWHLARSEDLSVILELDGWVKRLGVGQGLEVAPGVLHQLRNESAADVECLVVSSEISREDRYPT